jgi:hypothetical protein
MELREITELAQFDDYYGKHNLGATKEEIEGLPDDKKEKLFNDRMQLLRDAMGITAVRCEYGSTSQDALMLLEDVVLFDKWMLKP